MGTIEKLFIGVMCVASVFFAYLVLVVAPVGMYADAECLRNGYPKYHVTIGLERYCSTLDGAVTVKVTKQ